MNVFQKIKTYSIVEFLVLLILITLPLGYAVNSISIILFFIGSFLLRVFKIEKYSFNNINILLILFFGLCFSSLLWTDNIENTKNVLPRFLSFLVLPIAFSIKTDTNFKKEKVLSTFSQSLVFYAFYCLFIGVIKAFKSKDISYLFYHQLSQNLSNMSAIYLSVFISFAILYYLNKKIKSRVDIFYLFFLGLFLILLSSKTIITITFLLSIIIFLKDFELKKINIKQFFFIGLILLIFIIASVNFHKRFETEFNKTNITEVLTKKEFGHVYLWTGTGLRVFQIKAFYEVFLEKRKYLLGLGLNNSQKSLNEKYNEYNLYPGFLNFNYHNQYIQILAELGIVGLLIGISILILITKQAVFYKDHFLLSFIFFTLVVFMTESFMWRQRGMVFFITILLLFNKKNNELFK
tara:strand:- start:12559 stop:13779 length:1221 start_codon:yes stop_codon:yes gene_type:complete